MKYALLIYNDEDGGTDGMNEDEIMGGYYAFTESIGKSGQMQAGEALEPIATAKTVRVRNGVTETTDGPFAETKEQLGGFYIVDCTDLDEAIGVAAQIPGARYGTIEVRPVMVFEMPQGG